MTAGHVLALIRAGTVSTRTDIVRLSGMSRTAVNARITALRSAGLVSEQETGPSTGGRPPARIALATDTGVVAGVALGRSRLQVGLFDLGGRLLANDDHDMDLTIGPEKVMPTVTKTLGRMLTKLGRSQADLRSFGCSIPGTVDTVRGAVHESPLMGRWDGIPLAPYLQELAAVPVAVENDVFVLALSERSGHLRRHDDLIAVKASTGLGVGVVTGGQILRGTRGGAGELGHVRSPSAGQQQCRCGETGCLETVAAGWALVQLMNESGYKLAHVRDLVALVLSGDALARSVVREAGRRVGEVLATAVCLLNPSAVVIGGDMAPAYDTFAAGLRETLYANATAFSTKELVIVEASHRELAGLVGSGQLAVEHILSPVLVDRALASIHA